MRVNRDLAKEETTLWEKRSSSMMSEEEEMNSVEGSSKR